MIERNITLPEMILWTGTRIALGTGIGLLISRGLSSYGCRRLHHDSTRNRHYRQEKRDSA